MTDSDFDKIEKHYTTYLIESDHYNKPLIKGQSKLHMVGKVGELERKHLMAYNEDLPLPHELEYNSLIKMPTQLTKLLQVQRSLDHLCFWAWTAEVVDYFDDLDRDIQRGYFLLLHVLLSKIGVQFSNNDDDKEIDRKMQVNRIADELINWHTRELEGNSSLAAYISYPLLEGLLKHILNDIIQPNGCIKNGEVLIGDNRTYDENDRCNSLKDLLHHVENNEADSDIQDQLKKQKRVIEQFGDGNDAYDVIYDWRNTLLHGEEMWDFQAGIITNIASSLIWDQIDGGDYNDERNEIVDRFMNQVNAPMPTNLFPYGFYPPTDLDKNRLYK